MPVSVRWLCGHSNPLMFDFQDFPFLFQARPYENSSLCQSGGDEIYLKRCVFAHIGPSTLSLHGPIKSGSPVSYLSKPGVEIAAPCELARLVALSGALRLASGCRDTSKPNAPSFLSTQLTCTQSIIAFSGCISDRSTPCNPVTNLLVA